MNEEPGSSELIFDDQYDRDFKPHHIDFRKLIDLMKAGSEAFKKDGKWWVQEYDMFGLLGLREVEEKVINQVRAYGAANIERTTTGLALKLKGER